MHYQLMAVDMDGTLLNDKKQIPQDNIDSINQALKAGKHIVLCSGRSVGEMERYFTLFPDMRYVICESGAEIYDIREKTFIFQKRIEPDYVKEVCETVKDQEVMPLFMINSRIYLSERDMDRLDYYRIENFEEHFRVCGHYTKDALSYCRETGYNASKICLFHRNTQERKETKDKLAGLPLELVYSEITSLEISPKGIDKGLGLSKLCRHLQIPIEESIAIGDHYNDMAMLRKAGLAVAMGNAIDEVKEMCHVTVADCNHSGVAEAVDRFLLR